MEGPFRDPGIPDGETAVYRGTLRGKPAGEGTLVVEARDDAYVQRISMQLLDELAYELEMRFARRNGTILAEHYTLRSEHHGRPLAVEQGWFRDVKALHWGGELTAYPHDVAPLLGCAVALRGMELRRGERRTFPVWLGHTVFWDVELRVERREHVEVPAGRIEAWRVRARPSFEQLNGALDKLIGMILPPFVLHLEAAPSQRLLRFEFPTGPFRWNPTGLIEAVSLSAS
jgi:hypothetical protein